MHPLIPKQKNKSKIKNQKLPRIITFHLFFPFSFFLSPSLNYSYILNQLCIYIASKHIDSVQKLILNPDMEFVDNRKLQLQQQPQPQEQHFHVLAVDDSVIDRKLLERLLRGSSCKGSYNMYPFFFFSFKLPSYFSVCVCC